MRTSLPDGKVKLGEKHTFVTGLSSILKDKYRKQALDALDSGSKTAGAIMHATSMLITLYANFLLDENIDPPETSGATRTGDVFTQELFDFGMSLFKSNAINVKSRNNADAYIILKDLYEQSFTLEDGTTSSIKDTFEKQDATGLTAALHSWAKSMSVSFNNHLLYTAEAHTSRYLSAKYSSLYLSKREVLQLARSIGRSVQWNDYRTKQLGKTYMRLPLIRKADKNITFQGKTVIKPSMTKQQWRELVRAEQKLIPRTWSQWDTMKNKYRMLKAINELNTPERTFKGFNLLPTFSAGRAFLKLNKAGLYEVLGARAHIPIKPPNILDVFEPKKLDSLLRNTDKRQKDLKPLILGGEFFRTDGVQAQFYCGLPVGTKRSSDGQTLHLEQEEIELTPETGWDQAELDAPDPSEDVPFVGDVELLGANDPGATFPFNIGFAKKVSGPSISLPNLQPLGDGQYVDVKLGYRLSARRWNELRGFNRARRRRKKLTSGDPYKNAVSMAARAPLGVSNFEQLGRNILIRLAVWKDIHTIEGSRAVARLRFHQFMKKQSAIKLVVNEVFDSLGPDRVLALGSGNWKHQGRLPQAAQLLQRAVRSDPRARFPTGQKRIFLQPEQYTSQKCSCCMGSCKMENPKHKFVYENKYEVVDGHRKKIGRGYAEGGARVHGQYQCKTEGCYRTWDRDRNAAFNIFRCAWERMHGRERPATLRGS